MVPEGAGVWPRELIDEAFTWLDGRPSQTWNAIHGIWQADTVPMHRGVFVKSVLDRSADKPTLLYAQDRSGNGPVVSPDGMEVQGPSGPARFARPCIALSWRSSTSDAFDDLTLKKPVETTPASATRNLRREVEKSWFTLVVPRPRCARSGGGSMDGPAPGQLPPLYYRISTQRKR